MRFALKNIGRIVKKGVNKMILRGIISVLLGFLFMLFFIMIFFVPYAVVGIAIAFLMAISAVVLFGVEATTIYKKLVSKAFYCPFRKTNVEVKLRPSIFTFRPYDDVITCSAFKGKITCKKRCLGLPELPT